jgi:hypothetical protein
LFERQFERARTDSETINPFWSRRMDESRDQLAQPVLDKAQLLLSLGCWVERLGPGQQNRDLPALQHILANLKAPQHAEKADREHFAAVLFLVRRGLLDPCLADLDALGWTSSYGAIRHWWYAHRTRALLKGPANFLEIGPGGAHIAILLANWNLVRSYVLVDLPQMLLNSIDAVEEHLPGSSKTIESIDAEFSFLQPEEIGLIPSGSIDCALNFNSFSEMDDGVRDRYLAEVYRTAKPGAIFYNVNRRHKAMTRLDGSAFENHPMLYPYQPDDRVLEWEPDEFQQATRSDLFSTPQKSFCISRIASVRQPSSS